MWELRLLGSPELASRGQVDAPDLRAFARQPKRIALLALLALAPPPGTRRRDSILGLLWPELDDTRARAALRQLLHHLRRTLGAAAIVGSGSDEIGLSPSVWCDVGAFDEALRERRPMAALQLYRADLLQGFFVTGAPPEFEQWLEAERARLRAAAAKAAWRVADERRSARDAAGALMWARRASSLMGDDESSLQRLIAFCDRIGDRAAAVRAYEEFSARLARDYGVEPSAETQALLQTVVERQEVRGSGAWLADADSHLLRRSSGSGRHPTPVPRRASPRASPPPPRPSETRAAPAAPPPGRRLSRSSVFSIALAALGVVAMLWAWAPRRTQAMASGEIAPAPHVIAVGEITDFTGNGSGAAIVRAAREALSVELARLSSVSVLAGPARGEFEARTAGAGEYIGGSVRLGMDGVVQLRLERIQAATGKILGTYSADGRDGTVLAKTVTADLVTALADRFRAMP